VYQGNPPSALWSGGGISGRGIFGRCARLFRLRRFLYFDLNANALFRTFETLTATGVAERNTASTATDMTLFAGLFTNLDTEARTTLKTI